MRPTRKPHVSLILEAAFASGRNILQGVTHFAREHGAWIFHHEWRNTDVFYPHWLDSWSGDGAIARVETERIAQVLAASEKPVVDVLGEVPGHLFPQVHVDDHAIGALAARYMLERGFRCFAYCGLSPCGWSERRRDGYLEALTAEGFEAEVLERPMRSRRPRAWEVQAGELAEWLLHLRKPAALMLCNDVHGYEVLEACRMAGITIPGELALIGVDDDETVCEVCQPQLSSVITNDRLVGYEAARLLARLMAGGRWNGKPILVPPSGVRTRLSSDILAIEDSAVVAALQYIQEHAREGVTVADVARHVPVCRSLLQRRFKHTLGRTLHDEIQRVRIDHVKFLLEESDLPLAVIAEKAGFRHQAYLGAVFRKHTGQTPLQYRRHRQHYAGTVPHFTR